MKNLAYSSVAAFLAHYRVLSEAADEREQSYLLSRQDQEILRTMRQLMEPLRPEERTILTSGAGNEDEKSMSGEERRRLERAELKLSRLLRAEGVLRE